MRIWSFNSIAISLFVFALHANATEKVANDDMRFMLQAKQTMDDVRKQIETQRAQQEADAKRPNWTQSQSYISQAELLTQQSQGIKEKALGVTTTPNGSNQENLPGHATDGGEVILFASFAIPEYTLKSMLQASVDSPVPIRVVFRGLKSNTGNLAEASLAIQKLVASAKLSKQPKVQIDPRLFNQYSVNVAPTMLYRKAGKVVIGTGLESVSAFVDQATEMKQSGSLGSFSDSYPIKEEDILQLIQERFAKIDWEQKKKAAIGRYWKRQQMPLTELKQDDDVLYAIDPRVKFIRDEVDNRGNVYAKAGDIVDPTQNMPFNTTLYVVDARSERQLSWLEHTLAQPQSRTDGLQYILLSAMPESDDFSAFGKLQKRFGQHLYLLQADMMKKFQMEHVPAKVQIQKGQIRVTEFGARNLSQYQVTPINIGN